MKANNDFKNYYNRPKFSRDPTNIKEYNDFVNLIKKKLNINNLFKWNKFKEKKYITANNYKNYISYLFKLFNEWLKTNEIYLISFLVSLNTLVERLELFKYFNQQEQNYIDYILNIIFAKTRSLKDILVDFKLFKKEQVYYVYDVDYIEEKYMQNESIISFLNSNIFITTKRIVVASKNEYISLKWSDIQEVNLKLDSLEICMLKHVIKVKSLDLHIIYISIERICKILGLYK